MDRKSRNERSGDIDAGREVARAYGERVPVVAMDGKVLFRSKVNRVLLERLRSR